MAYTWKTFLAARNDLFSRLQTPQDSTGFWTSIELGLTIQESIRTWNAIAGWFRAQDTFQTSASVAFYDLTSDLSNSSLSQTIADTDIYRAILYHLMEVPYFELAPNENTEQIGPLDMVAAVNRRRDQFLLETGMFLTRLTPSIPGPPANGRVVLSDQVIDIRRVAFAQGAGLVTPMYKTDEMTQGQWNTPWLAPGTASTYSTFMTPHVGITLMPPPSQTGSLDLITVNTGPQLVDPPPQGGQVLGVPDDWSWVIKWGAMADLLSRDGEAPDPPRADYCQQRWNEGIQLAKLAASVQTVMIGTTILPTSTLTQLDRWNQMWQSITGTPATAAFAGLNIVALSPVPNSVLTVTMDLVTNAIVPVNDTDFLQIGREQYDVILDYAEHLAAFKMGGQEFAQTAPLLQRFMRLAIENNARLQAQAFAFPWMRAIGQKQERSLPRKEEVANVA